MNCVDRSLVVTYVDGPQLSLSVAELVEKLAGYSSVFSSRVELENHCRKHGAAVLLLVWPCGANPLLEEDFNRLMVWLERLHSSYSSLQPILIIQSELSVGQSCLAITSGVTAIADFSQSDFDDTLLECVSDAYQCYLEKSLRQDTDGNQDASAYGMVGHSSALREVVSQAHRASSVSDAPVVIYGESGTGKQRLAEMIHALDGKRSNYPFISVNCAAITGSLAESELFGHRKGAFTGATEDRQGYFRAANKGTILLDEIGELSLSLQPKILRVLQDSVVMPVGSDKEYGVDLRIIAATHRDLKQMILQGKFRLDLYQRLNVIQLHAPSLRERVEDIPELFESFLEKYAHYSRCEIEGVDELVYEVLGESLGSGNIRELENLVRQILIFKEQGHRIEISDLPLEMIRRAGGQQIQGDTESSLEVSEELIESLARGRKTLSNAVDEYEELMLRRLINRNVSQTTLADRLGITRRTLYNKLHKYKLR